MPQPYNMTQMPQRQQQPLQPAQDMPPAQANLAAISQNSRADAAMPRGKSQNAPVVGKEVMRRPPTLQPIPGGAMGGQAMKTGINPENRNINQTMGTGIISAQMNRSA
jgi:hypothetical protein